MTGKKISSEDKIKSFFSEINTKIRKGKPFTITFNKEKGKVSKNDIVILDQELRYRSHIGGFLPFLGIILALMGNIVKSFTGQGININENFT